MKLVSILMELRKFESVLHRKIAGAMPETEQGRLFHVQAMVVQFLKENEERPVCQRDVEEHLNIRSSSATKLLQRMEENGFIVRTASETDKRVKTIRTTEKAENLWRYGLSKMDRLVERLEKNVEPEEKDTFFRVLKKIEENLDEGFDVFCLSEPPEKERLC